MKKDKQQVEVHGKKSKTAFILSVGDEGAILTHFDKGVLINRVFVDSPFSPDIKLMKKLFDLYPRIPITIYVDTIEQNYVHSNLPPLSASAVKKQAARKMERDFQPNDLNNFIPIGREKDGRKDWKFLFISLANTEPFSNWIELVLEQKNKLNGIYVLAVESQQMVSELNTKLTEKASQEWELVVMHNKVSGFRISAFYQGKIYFTRLTQHVVGENVAEVVAGNLEQEISNTIEYLKRLGFTTEEDAHISVIANEEILKKLELTRMNFGKIDKYTPYGAAKKLGITYAVKENDRYSDILCASHFANLKKKSLKFNSKLSREVMNLQTAITATSIGGVLAFVAIAAMIGMLATGHPEAKEKASKAASRKQESTLSLERLKEKKESLPEDIGMMVEVLDIHNRLPQMPLILKTVIYKAVEGMPDNTKISGIDIVFADVSTTDNSGGKSYSQQLSDEAAYINPFGRQAPQAQSTKEIKDLTLTHSYEGELDIVLEVRKGELDILNDTSEKLMTSLQDNEYGIVFSYSLEPQTTQNQLTEKVTDREETKLNEIVGIPATIKFQGSVSEEKKSN